jgi:hypothetical protein
MSRLLPNLVRFGQMLHKLGLPVPGGRMIEVAQALEYVDVGHRKDFYFTLRTLLVHRVEDLPLFDQAFRTFWRPPRGEKTTVELRALGEERRFGKPKVEEESLRAEPALTGRPGAPAETVELRTYSGTESLREKDFAKLTQEELEQARALLSQLRWAPGFRRSRRWRAGTQGADLRRLLRNAMRNRGESFVVPGRNPKLKRRPIVLLCDISGSMERYARMLLQFVHCISEGFERVEGFLFATRLTRITLQMRGSRMDRAFAKLPSIVPDWSGGTRIGDALRAFNLNWARRVLSRGTVVLLISDGWDRGDPAVLRGEMARLQRSCGRLIWLNPLLGSPEYEPLTRGMQAALPYVDDFLPIHNLVSLESLAKRLNTLSERRRRVC